MPQMLLAQESIDSVETIKIGTQLWYKENLKQTQFSDTTIHIVRDSATWSTISVPACYIVDSLDKDIVYYNWYAVNTNKLCPQGWRVSWFEMQ